GIAIGYMRNDGAIRVDLRADQVKRAEDDAIVAAQNHVAEPSHDFDDQPDGGNAFRRRGAAAKADLDDTLPTRLANGDDARAFQVFAQQHDEGRRLGNEFARLLVDEVD